MPQPHRVSTLEIPRAETVAPVAAGALIPAGNLVARNAAGFAVLAANTASLVVLGVAAGPAGSPLRDDPVDNTAGTDGAQKVRLCRSIFRFRNSTAHPVTGGELGKLVMVENEETVAASAPANVTAGVALGIEPGYVWVWLPSRPNELADPNWRGFDGGMFTP